MERDLRAQQLEADLLQGVERPGRRERQQLRGALRGTRFVLGLRGVQGAARTGRGLGRQQGRVLQERRRGGQSVAGADPGGCARQLRGGPLVLLYSNNLELTRDAILAAGGSIVTETYEFPGGRRLHFADPSGNELGVWSEA